MNKILNELMVLCLFITSKLPKNKDPLVLSMPLMLTVFEENYIKVLFPNVRRGGTVTSCRPGANRYATCKNAYSTSGVTTVRTVPWQIQLYLRQKPMSARTSRPTAPICKRFTVLVLKVSNSFYPQWNFTLYRGLFWRPITYTFAPWKNVVLPSISNAAPFDLW